MGSGVSSFGFRVSGFGFRVFVSGFGFRVSGLRFHGCLFEAADEEFEGEQMLLISHANTYTS